MNRIVPRPAWIAIAIGWSIALIIIHAIPMRNLIAIDGGKVTAADGPDKMAHVVLFSAFSAFWMLAAPARPLLIFVLGLGYGVLLELMQWRFVAGRSGSVHDFFADGLGLIVGLAITLSIVRWTRKS